MTRSCPVCYSPPESAAVLHESTFDAACLDLFSFSSRKTPEKIHPRYLRCRACGAAYASPYPDIDVSGLYASAEFTSGEESLYAARSYAAAFDRCRRDPGAGPVLDIGCGDGAFLGELHSRGYDCRGIEPSEKPHSLVPDHLKGGVTLGFFGEGVYSDCSFEAVCCCQVLEHLPSPSGAVKAMRTVLRPGGLLFVVTHDFESLPNRLMGGRSPVWDIEHFQLFSPKSIGHMLALAGFRQIRVKRFINRYPLPYWARLLPAPVAMKSACIRAAHAAGKVFPPVPLYAGNMLVTAVK